MKMKEHPIIFSEPMVQAILQRKKHRRMGNRIQEDKMTYWIIVKKSTGKPIPFGRKYKQSQGGWSLVDCGCPTLFSTRNEAWEYMRDDEGIMKVKLETFGGMYE